MKISIGTADGVVEADLGLPPRLRLAHLAYAFLPVSEKLAALAARRSSNHGMPVSCRPRCAGCCRQLVPVSPAEAFFLADLVTDATVREAFASANDAWERSGLREAEAAGGDAVDIALQWTKKALPCPFLREELCSIYTHRPAACREYLVTTPRENCYQLGRAPITRVPLTASVSDALSIASAKMLGRDVERIPLPTALAWADAHAEENARTWPSDEMVAALVEALERR